MVSMNITATARQRALLLHYVGEDTNEIFDTLPNTEAAEDINTLTKAIDALTVHFEDKKNIVFEEYQFRQARQEDDETIQAYHTRLKKLAQNCEFADVDSEIKAQVIQHCTSTKLRRKGLKDPTVSEKDLLDYDRTLELTETRIIDLEQSNKAVNKLRHTTSTKRYFNSNTRDNHRKPCAVPKPTQGHKKHDDKKETEGKPRKSNSTCRNCGKNTHTKGECLNARPKEVNATIVESSTTLPNTAGANLDKKTPPERDRLIENPLDALVYANLAMIVKVTKMFLRSVVTALETTATRTQCSKLESMTHS